MSNNYPDWLEERFGDDIPDWAEERWGESVGVMMMTTTNNR
jgi:hypothetical protein